MQRTMNCSQCGAPMDYRLGVYSCADCGREQAAAAAPVAGGARIRTEAMERGRADVDPTAAYQLQQQRQSDVAQAALVDTPGPLPAAKRGEKLDMLRGEKTAYLVLGLPMLAGFLYLLLSTVSGAEKRQHIRELFALPAALPLEFIIVIAVLLFMLLGAAAAFYGPRALKMALAVWAGLMTFAILGVVLVNAAGMLLPQHLYALCYSVEGALLFIPSAWLMALLGRDMSGSV